MNVHLDVSVRIFTLQEKQLSNDHIRHMVVNRCPQEHDALFEKERVNIVSTLATVRAFHDHGDYIAGVYHSCSPWGSPDSLADSDSDSDAPAVASFTSNSAVRCSMSAVRTRARISLWRSARSIARRSEPSACMAARTLASTSSSDTSTCSWSAMACRTKLRLSARCASSRYRPLISSSVTRSIRWYCSIVSPRLSRSRASRSR